MSLTACIKKAGEFLDPQDKTKILSRARELRADGLTAKQAGRQAVDEVLESVQAELNSMGGMDAATDEKEDNQGKIDDVGEKIGGARKDTAISTGAKRKAMNAEFDKFVEVLETKVTDKGVALYTQYQPSRPLAAFRKLTGSASASTARADAEAVLGMPSPVPVLTEANYELAEKRVPMWYDLNKKTIYYNTAYKGHDRARDAQWMTEEIMHAVDHIDGMATISASSETLRSGELRTELEAAVKRGGALYDILRYPLDMQQEFTEDRIVAELFARTAVVYNGSPELLKAASPKTYEVFHGFFQRRNEAVQSQARRDSADRGEESGGLGADRASSTRADGAGRTSEKLARFRDEIAAGIGGKREGRRANLGGLTLSSSQAASRGTNTAMANRNDVVGNQGGRSADDTTPSARAAQQILKAIKQDNDDNFADYALRVIPGDFNGEVKSGDILPVSKNWEDGTETDQELKGTSAVLIKRLDENSVLQALKNLGALGKNGPNGYYYGDRVVLIKGGSIGAGEDVGESIIQNAEVVEVWKKPSKGLSEIQPNEPTAPDSDGAFSRASILATVNTPTRKAARSLWFDETGRLQFAPGAAVNQWLADGIVGKALSRAMLRTASPAMRKQLRAMKLAVQDAQDKAVEVAKATQAMSPQELAMVSDVIEQELSSGTVPPAEVLRMAAVMDTAMAQQTKELVSLGMLTAETAARWDGKYLPRYYGKSLGKTVEAAWEKAARMLTRKPSALTGIKGKHLKGRGMYANASANKVQDWLDLGYEIRDADLDASIKTAADVKGLIKNGDLKPRDEVQVWRDFTRAERDDMGEIRDASLRFTLGYMETQRDIALGRMFEAMASDPELSSKTATEKHTERVPDGTLEGSGAKRYGKLSGRYISRDDFSQLDNATGIESEMFKVYKEGLAKWKEGKTVLNPVAHFNNIVSNMSMAHFAGVSYWDTHKYIGALYDFATSAPKIKEARDAGLFLGTVSDEELRNMLPEELRKLVVQTESYGRKAGRFAFNVMALGLRKPLGAAYQAEDLFYRYLIWKDATNRGLDPEDAVDYAQKFIFDYSDLPKTARAIRDFGIPFFSYTYKFIPAFVSTALTHPTRLAAPAAVLWGLQAMAYGLLASGDEEDEGVLETIWQSVTDPVRRKRAMELAKEEEQNLPEWMKGATSIGTPRAIRLKNDKSTGLPMFIDVSRIVPGGDIFDVNANAGGLPMLQWLTPSNPLLTTFGAMFLNRDSFTGKDIVDKEIDTDMEAAKKRSNWLWKQWTPAIAAGNYHWERTMQAAATANGGELPAWVPDLLDGDSTGVGKDGVAVTPGRAALNTVGIKIRPIDLDRSEEMNESQKDRLLREIDARVRSLERQHEAGAISDRTIDKEIDLAAEKRDRLRDGKDVDGDEK